MIKQKLLFIILIILTFLLISGISQKRINILYKDRLIDQPNLTIIEGKGYLRAIDLANIYKLKLDWYAVSKKVIFSKSNKEVILFVNSEEVIIDKIKRKMNIPPFLDENILMVPLELILTHAFNNTFSCSTIWDRENNALTIAEKIDGQNDEPGIVNTNKEEINVFPPYFITYLDHTKVFVETTTTLEYVIEREPATNSIALKIPKGKLDMINSAVMVKNNVIKNISAQQDTDNASLIMHLDKFAGDFKVSKSTNPPGIEINIDNLSFQPTADQDSDKNITATDITKPVYKQIVQPVTTPPLPPKKTNLTFDDTPISLNKVVTNIPSHLKIKTIVIDPGHGGKDSGAVGPSGTEEKDIVLDVAKRLAKLIKKHIGATVILTRTDDTFIPLAVRTQIANEKKADLFVSIHANAALSPKTKGFEIYFLSEKASDAEAEAVANMENSVIEMEDPSPKLNDLTTILWSMTLNNFMNDSSLLSSLINKEVRKLRLGIEERGVKQASFHVLRGTKMPAVLVELAFISNKEEERKLRSRNFKNKMAEAIYKGIFNYKKQLATKNR